MEMSGDMVEAWGGDCAVVEVKGVAEKMEAEEALANAMVVAVMVNHDSVINDLEVDVVYLKAQ